MQARSQPARWGGSELGWVEHQAHPPLGHCPRDVIKLKNAPTLGHSQAPPPLGHCPCDITHIFQGWNKIAEGWNKIAEGWNKIAKGWNKIAERWNKIAKGWNKIAKGWNKIFGMGNWGGRTTPPTPPTPPGYGPAMLCLLLETPLTTALGLYTCLMAEHSGDLPPWPNTRLSTMTSYLASRLHDTKYTTNDMFVS